MYRDSCVRKLPWDCPLPENLAKRWKTWECNPPPIISTPRSLATYREPIQAIDRAAFVRRRKRLWSRNCSFCRSLSAKWCTARPGSRQIQISEARTYYSSTGVSCCTHGSRNIVTNLRRALEGFPVVSVHGWTDSAVALHWICGNGDYRQFVANRVRKILEHNIDAWRHVSSIQKRIPQI